MISILLVDDDRTVLELLPNYFEGSDLSVTHKAHSFDEALAALHEKSFDVVLTDLRMPGRDGIELVKAFKRLAPHVPVVGITSFDSDENIVEVLRAGAKGFVLKSARPAEIVLALQLAVQGQTYISPEVAGKVTRYLGPAHQTTPPNLSARQLEVLNLLCDGFENQDIAKALGISLPTVKKHVSSLLREYQVTTRLQLVAKALKQ